MSVIDRLVGEELLADELAVPGGARSDPTLLYRAGVRRNLEWLLNTRRVIEPAPDAFPEVQRSIYHFGLPDVTSLGSDSEANRRELSQMVAEAIETFEPRLSNVRVSIPPAAAGERGVRFVIEATLRVDLDEERIELDTLLETSSGRFSITGARNA